MHPDSEHYSSEQWSDFVREIAEPRVAIRMRGHLDGGCEECAKTVGWLQTVVHTVAESPYDDPPAELMLRAKAIFNPSRREQTAGWREVLETMVASLVLESSGDWLPAGVRSGGSAGQRLLYRAGSYAIDLTMDPGAPYGEVAEIVGQIVDEQDMAPELGMLRGIPVQLWMGDRVLGETETNQFGEFVLQRPTAKAAVLRFALTGAGKQIEIPIKRGQEQSK